MKWVASIAIVVAGCTAILDLDPKSDFGPIEHDTAPDLSSDAASDATPDAVDVDAALPDMSPPDPDAQPDASDGPLPDGPSFQEEYALTWAGQLMISMPVGVVDGTVLESGCARDAFVVGINIVLDAQDLPVGYSVICRPLFLQVANDEVPLFVRGPASTGTPIGAEDGAIGAVLCGDGTVATGVVAFFGNPSDLGLRCSRLNATQIDNGWLISLSDAVSTSVNPNEEEALETSGCSERRLLAGVYSTRSGQEDGDRLTAAAGNCTHIELTATEL